MANPPKVAAPRLTPRAEDVGDPFRAALLRWGGRVTTKVGEILRYLATLPNLLDTFLTKTLAASTYVPYSLFDAHTVLAATTDNTPAALTVTEQSLVGRVTSGNIAALTGTQAEGILNRASYGVLYTHENATAQGSIDTTPVKVTNFDTAGDYAGDVSVDAVSNKITVGRAGTYLVNMQVNFSGSTGTTFIFHIYKNGSATDYSVRRDMGTAGSQGSASIVTVMNLAVNDYLEVYVEAASGSGKSITVVNGQLMVAWQSFS